MWQRLRRAMQVRQLAASAFGLSFGVLIGVGTNWLSDSGVFLLPVVFIVTMGLAALNIWLWLRRPVNIGLNVREVTTVRTAPEKRAIARRGLIVCVSLYRPIPKQSAAASLPEADRYAAAAAKNYQVLDLLNSNLATTIEAILAHASQLEHCWLIATTSLEPRRGSSSHYVPSLIEYLRVEHGVKCQFHYGEDYEVSVDDDVKVFERTFRIVQRIYQEAAKLKIGARDMMADFTAGIRSMSLGVILASLDGDRDIEMIGTQYDPQGNWVGATFPITFDFEPVVQQTRG